jgi:hypothetical protein
MVARLPRSRSAASTVVCVRPFEPRAAYGGLARLLHSRSSCRQPNGVILAVSNLFLLAALAGSGHAAGCGLCTLSLPHTRRHHPELAVRAAGRPLQHLELLLVQAVDLRPRGECLAVELTGGFQAFRLHSARHAAHSSGALWSTAGGEHGPLRPAPAGERPQQRCRTSRSRCIRGSRTEQPGSSALCSPDPLLSIARAPASTRRSRSVHGVPACSALSGSTS